MKVLTVVLYESFEVLSSINIFKRLFCVEVSYSSEDAFGSTLGPESTC